MTTLKTMDSDVADSAQATAPETTLDAKLTAAGYLSAYAIGTTEEREPYVEHRNIRVYDVLLSYAQVIGGPLIAGLAPTIEHALGGNGSTTAHVIGEIARWGGIYLFFDAAVRMGVRDYGSYLANGPGIVGRVRGLFGRPDDEASCSDDA